MSLFLPPCRAIALSFFMAGCSLGFPKQSPASETISSFPFSPSQIRPRPTTVISTGDGDTLRVNHNGEGITVRLACIDSPERDQPGGQEAAERLRQLLPHGQSVQLRLLDSDRYGREVAEVYVDDQLINLTLVEEGYAVVYDQYLNTCAATRDWYLEAEQDAIASRRNFWAQADPIMPWDWRRSQDTPTDQPPPVLSQPSASSGPRMPACVTSDCDCADFRTQAEAQRILNAYPGDPHRLDGDSDGVACERLP